MSRGGRLLLPLAALLALAGCELTSVEIAEPEDVVVVEAYLRPDAGRQKVFLYRTLPGESGSLRVDGVEVRIRVEPQDGAGIPPRRPRELVLEPAPVAGLCADEDGLGDRAAGSCYVSTPSPGFVRPGETYTLEAALPDGRRLQGRTTVPARFEVLAPAPRQCVLDTVPYTVTWSRAEGAWAYQIVGSFDGLAEGLRARGVENPPDELELVGLAVGAADTTIVFPDELGVFDRFDVERELLLALRDGLPAGARAELAIAAGDRNFVNWARGGNFNPSGQVRVPSVTGDGTGVFGSLVVQRRVLLTDASEAPSCP